MVRVNDWKLKANLIPLNIRDFDVILGMDFLPANHVSIDCFHKEVVFRRPKEPRIIFNDERRLLPSCIISALDAGRLLRKGCHAQLAHVIDTQIIKLKLKHIPVVREFPNVFGEDLLELASGREIEFTINLILGTTLISQPHYRMVQQS